MHVQDVSHIVPAAFRHGYDQVRRQQTLMHVPDVSQADPVAIRQGYDEVRSSRHSCMYQTSLIQFLLMFDTVMIK